MTGGVKGTTRCTQAGPGARQCWQAMRILRRFTAVQLQTTCPELTLGTMRGYLQRLQRCGYINTVAKAPPGQPGLANTLALVRDSGPLAPIPRANSVSVFDPNTGRAWGDGGVLLDPKAPPALPPATNTMRAALVLMLEGQPPQHVLPDPTNGGALAGVMRALRKRGLVDAAGTLTEAGRVMAQADQQPEAWAQICPPGWQP